MTIVYPQFWNYNLDKEVIFSEFKTKVCILIDFYCRTNVIEGRHINGILDPDKLRSQQSVL